MPYLSTLEMWSQQGAIQNLYLICEEVKIEIRDCFAEKNTTQAEVVLILGKVVSFLNTMINEWSTMLSFDNIHIHRLCAGEHCKMVIIIIIVIITALLSRVQLWQYRGKSSWYHSWATDRHCVVSFGRKRLKCVAWASIHPGISCLLAPPIQHVCFVIPKFGRIKLYTFKCKFLAQSCIGPHELIAELSATDRGLNAGVYNASFRRRGMQCGSSDSQIESWFKEL